MTQNNELHTGLNMTSNFPTPWRVEVYRTHDGRLRYGLVAHSGREIFEYQVVDESTTAGIAYFQQQKEKLEEIAAEINQGSPFAAELQTWKDAHAGLLESMEYCHRRFKEENERLIKEIDLLNGIKGEAEQLSLEVKS